MKYVELPKIKNKNNERNEQVAGGYSALEGKLCAKAQLEMYSVRARCSCGVSYCRKTNCSGGSESLCAGLQL